MVPRAIVLCSLLLLLSANARAAAPPAGDAGEKKTSLLTKIWDRTELGMLWYLSYGHGMADDKRFNRVHVSRGYVTLKLKPVSWFQTRVTMDTHQDDEGDWKVRLKYLYGKFILPIETRVVTEPHIEAGIVQTPWFNFEEHVNNYRMEGTMFTERNQIMNSADLGATVVTLLGRKLPREYQERVSSSYPGTWGSMALGVYNGGGYHAAEENNDKVFEARVSLRPLGPFHPNLQLSYFVIQGKGNTKQTPDWRLHDVMLSYEHQYFVVTGQFATGTGNQKGDRVDATTGESIDYWGGSGFAELKLPWIRSTLIGRYDYFDWDDGATSRIIAGYAFHFLPHNFVLLSLDHLTHHDSHDPVDWQVKLTLQVHYP
jgi:hypothetical protein